MIYDPPIFPILEFSHGLYRSRFCNSATRVKVDTDALISSNSDSFKQLQEYAP